MKIKYEKNSTGNCVTQCQPFPDSMVGSCGCSHCDCYNGQDDDIVNCNYAKPTKLDILKGILGADKEEQSVLNQLIEFCENPLGLIPGDLMECGGDPYEIQEFVHYVEGDPRPWKALGRLFKAVKIYNKPEFSKGQVLVFWDDDGEDRTQLSTLTTMDEHSYQDRDGSWWDNARALTEKEYKGEGNAND